MRLGELPGGILQLLRAHVARGRVDEVAAEPDCFDLRKGAGVIDAARRLQLGNLVATSRLVAPEAVGAEPPGDGRKLGLRKLVGQVIAAGRQDGRQQADGQLRLVHGIAGALLAEPEDHARERAFGPRQQHMLPRDAFEALGLRPSPLRLAQRRLAHPSRVAGEPDRHRLPLRVGRQQHGSRCRCLLRLFSCCHG